MADKTLRHIDGPTQTNIDQKMRDLGSGQYAESVWVEGGSLPAKGSRTHSVATPTTSAVSVLAANSSRKSATIQNAGTVDVYLGKDNTLTTSTGIKLAAGDSLQDKNSTEAWWAITSSGTGDLRIIEVA